MSDDGKIGVQAIIDLGQLSLAFGRVDRVTYHEDGTTPESDTDHTVMLGLVACAFAARYLPELDLGEIAQLALVHDVVEVYAGDTSTLRIDGNGRKAKKARERAAEIRIHDEFSHRLPWLSVMIGHYENLDTPEARYVKAMDKLLPKITHILNGQVTLIEQGMSWDALKARYEEQFYEIWKYAHDFVPLLQLRLELIEIVMHYYGQAVRP